MRLFHDEECDKSVYEEGATCTCALVGYGDYEDEPSNMAAMENGETFGELW